MDDAELTVRVIAASGPSAVDDLVTFLRKRIADDRDTLDSISSPAYVRRQPLGVADLSGVGGGTTALVPLGRFDAHLDALDSTLNKYEAALSHTLRGKEMGWDHNNAQVALVAYMDVIKLQALEYATHPDFKENWRP